MPDAAARRRRRRRRRAAARRASPRERRRRVRRARGGGAVPANPGGAGLAEARGRTALGRRFDCEGRRRIPRRASFGAAASPRALTARIPPSRARRISRSDSRRPAQRCRTTWAIAWSSSRSRSTTQGPCSSPGTARWRVTTPLETRQRGATVRRARTKNQRRAARRPRAAPTRRATSRRQRAEREIGLLRGPRAPPRARVPGHRVGVSPAVRLRSAAARGSATAPTRRSGSITSPPPRAATTVASVRQPGERHWCLSFWTTSPASPCRWAGCSRPRPALRPRLFSIASSRAVGGFKATSQGRAPRGPRRTAARAGMLDGADERFYVRRRAFSGARLVKGAAAFPDDSQAVVACAPGAGSRPLRAMVRQRDARLASDAGGTCWRRLWCSSGAATRRATFCTRTSGRSWKTRDAARELREREL